jgi:hypothetical protein
LSRSDGMTPSRVSLATILIGLGDPHAAPAPAQRRSSRKIAI